MPQPNFVPVRFSVSRRTQSKGICGSTSTVWDFPFKVKVTAIKPPARETLPAPDILLQLRSWSKMNEKTVQPRSVGSSRKSHSEVPPRSPVGNACVRCIQEPAEQFPQALENCFQLRRHPYIGAHPVGSITASIRSVNRAAAAYLRESQTPRGPNREQTNYLRRKRAALVQEKFRVEAPTQRLASQPAGRVRLLLRSGKAQRTLIADSKTVAKAPE